MTCRHSDYDPACGSYKSNLERLKKDYEKQFSSSVTPDSKNYEIIDVEPVGSHLVMKVLYTNCKKCSYEGNKIMVFLNCTMKEAMKWKTIDPHFRDIIPIEARISTEAPGPDARFPASEAGWEMAVEWAKFIGESYL